MKQQHTRPVKEHDKPESPPTNGKDEMNLAEFPFASLTRIPGKNTIVYEGWITDKEGNRLQQRWVVAGNIASGSPTEFDERVLVALMAITTEQRFVSRKVPFSVYQIIKIMGLVRSEKEYRNVERSLDRLVGVTIKSEGAFWDNAKKECITTKEAFHIIEKYWLRYREENEKVREKEGVPGYIIWGEDIWNSFKANYIKPLDLQFFYSLESPTARRLYRLLDKRMWNRDRYEFDIFDLAGRLGMVNYTYPTRLKRKLQPAFDELISRGFLKSAKPIKVKGYNRIRFFKAPKSAPESAEQHDDAQQETEAYEDRYTTQLNALRQRYGITEDLVDIWEEALVEIKGATTTANFQMWFPQTHLLSCKQGIALIGVPSTFAQDWLAGRMTPVIQRALEGATGESVGQLAFQVLETK